MEKVSISIFFFGCFVGGLLSMLGCYAAFRHATSVEAKEKARSKLKSDEAFEKRRKRLVEIINDSI